MATPIDFEIDGEVAADHPFRARGSAARVEIRDGVAILDHGSRLFRRGAFGEFRKRLCIAADDLTFLPIADNQHVFEAGRVVQTGLQLVQQRAFDGYASRPRMVEHVAEFLVPPEQIDRHADQTELRTRKIDKQELDVVGRHQCKDVSTDIAE